MFVKPIEDYKLLGTSIVLDKNKVYHACLATNQPNWKEREAIFCDEVLLEKGEYEIVFGKPNEEIRPDFDYDCECGYHVCNTCGYPCYPMELDTDREDLDGYTCFNCEEGYMVTIDDLNFEEN